MNKRKIITVLIIAIAFFVVVFLIELNKGLYSTYDFGDSGVSITVYNKFKEFKDEKSKTDVALYNEELKTYVSGRNLPDNFWASGDMLANCDEYVRTISAMYYDRDVKNVSIDTSKIKGVEVGKVKMTVSQKNSSNTVVSLLFPPKYKNLIIEIYGDEKIIENDDNIINDLISGIRIK